MENFKAFVKSWLDKITKKIDNPQQLNKESENKSGLMIPWPAGVYFSEAPRRIKLGGKMYASNLTQNIINHN